MYLLKGAINCFMKWGQFENRSLERCLVSSLRDNVGHKKYACTWTLLWSVLTLPGITWGRLLPACSTMARTVRMKRGRFLVVWLAYTAFWRSSTLNTHRANVTQKAALQRVPNHWISNRILSVKLPLRTQSWPWPTISMFLDSQSEDLIISLHVTSGQSISVSFLLVWVFPI